MGKSKTKSIKLRMRAFGMPNAQDIAFNHQSMKIFAEEISRLNTGLTNLTSGINRNLSDGRVINKLIRQFGKEQLKSFKGNFIRNPKQWIPLHETAKKIREYKMDPMKLKDDILNAMIFEQKEISLGTVQIPIRLVGKQADSSEISGILTRFMNTMPKIPKSRVVAVTPGYPALVFTGRLMRSMRFKYIKGRKTINSKQLIYRRSLHYSSTAVYARTHFTGGQMPTYQLVITRTSSDFGDSKSFEFKFPIPNEYVSRLRNLTIDLLHSKVIYRVDVVQKMTRVEPRNPYIFSSRDLRRLKTLNQNFGVIIPRAVDKKLKEALAA